MDINNIKFNKKYGQNFIFDKNLLNAIVKDSNIDKDDEVLEIGAGAGTLTKILAQSCKKVVAYEIDENLKSVLNENLADVKNVKLVFKDALKTDINLIEKDFEGKYNIVANLPYYITTPLIFKFIEQTTKVKTITIMIQQEVAERLIAKPSCKDYGIITVMLNFYGNVSITRKVARTNFIPVPNVDSAVVNIQLQNKFDCDKILFSKIVHGAFAMRRKTLINNLSKCFNIDKNSLAKILNQCNLDENVRAEQLDVLDYVKLTNLFSKHYST